MGKQRFSSITLASAFHKFGWVFGETVTKQAGALQHGQRFLHKLLLLGVVVKYSLMEKPRPKQAGLSNTKALNNE